jgi:pantoate--beta-alanine ligase
MEVINSNLGVKQWVKVNKNHSVGFVPTMGALHKGHLSLAQKAKSSCDKIVVSIFVNPTQFNNQNDLKNYPKKLEEDLQLLKENKVDMVFVPSSIEEVYNNENPVVFDLDKIDKVMEGAHRAGHFEGVGRVVKLLLELIDPDFAFFGEKDYQQLLIIKKVVDQFSLKAQIIGCETIREKDGLAMSSRNTLLNPDERKLAIEIYKSLKLCKENFHYKNRETLEKKCLSFLRTSLDPEYFEIRNADDLTKSGDIETKWRAFVASNVGQVRLIDNIALN